MKVIGRIVSFLILIDFHACIKGPGQCSNTSR
jgi:hypothetical protein